MVKPRMTLLFLLALACEFERPADYVFTDEYMLLPVEFRAMGATFRPTATWCVPLETLELCVYTEGERIRVGYTNKSRSDRFHVLWREARYIDEAGNPHPLELFPPDLAITESIEPGAHRWNSFVPSGKRYYRKDGRYYHVEWLVPWEEGQLNEEEAKRRVEAMFASRRKVYLEIPVVFPDGKRTPLVAVMQLLRMSDDEFWVRYAQAKAADVAEIGESSEPPSK